MNIYKFKIVEDCFTEGDCTYDIHRKFLFFKWRRLKGFAFSRSCAEAWLNKEREKTIFENIDTWTEKIKS